MLFGNGIGPAETVSASIASGRLPDSLGGVQVRIAGFSAPLLSAAPNQIRAIVPFEVMSGLPRGSGPVDVQVLNSATAVELFSATVVPLAPAIFTVDGRPEGQALMINQDGTLNSAQNPAAPGSVVTIYATGLNQTDPLLESATIATAAAPLVSASQLAVLAGDNRVTYAGAAPGLAAGVTQINFQLPEKNGPAGLVPLILQYRTPDSPESQLGVYFYAAAGAVTAGRPKPTTSRRSAIPNRKTPETPPPARCPAAGPCAPAASATRAASRNRCP
jgi:uncharacterized protein (TIGR03437 family)